LGGALTPKGKKLGKIKFGGGKKLRKLWGPLIKIPLLKGNLTHQNNWALPLPRKELI